MAGSVFGISIGAFAPSIKEQLESQGQAASKKDISLWQKMSDGLTLLRIHGVLTDGEMDKAGTRLVKKIGRTLREKGGE